jgi:hypothetical protein
LIVVVWVVMLCGFVGGTSVLEECVATILRVRYHFHLHLEGGGWTYLWNVCNHTSPQPRIPHVTLCLLWETEISDRWLLIAHVLMFVTWPIQLRTNKLKNCASHVTLCIPLLPTENMVCTWVTQVLFVGKPYPHEMNDELKAMHQKMKSMGDVKTFQILVLLLRLRQICCHPGLIESVSRYIWLMRYLLPPSSGWWAHETIVFKYWLLHQNAWCHMKCKNGWQSNEMNT